jgi:hypothetical protein
MVAARVARVVGGGAVSKEQAKGRTVCVWKDCEVGAGWSATTQDGGCRGQFRRWVVVAAQNHEH